MYCTTLWSRPEYDWCRPTQPKTIVYLVILNVPLSLLLFFQNKMQLKNKMINLRWHYGYHIIFFNTLICSEYVGWTPQSFTQWLLKHLRRMTSYWALQWSIKIYILKTYFLLSRQRLLGSSQQWFFPVVIPKDHECISLLFLLIGQMTTCSDFHVKVVP